MRLEITPQTMKDIERIKQKLIRAAQDIKNDTENEIQKTGHWGFNFAYNLAPEYTGALKEAMRLEFPDMSSFMIVSAQPFGDAIPTHILFDLGIYPNPRIASSLGFMKQTAIILQDLFAERLKMTIHHSIEKIGKGR
ncbi:MAG: hypothetical protein ACTSR3_05685 [Candidatus Helarchaeota archaeon]